jgi:glycosyltransferase involved in cell wall biosynthesis
MRVLQILTYYKPHISGLTIYVERLARGLAQRGHTVTILTSQYEASLPRNEITDDCSVVRVPVAFRIERGVVMPLFGHIARSLIRHHDIVHLHLPQFDGAGLTINARLLQKPSLLTYHCDIQLPSGELTGIVQPVIEGANHIAAMAVDRIVSYTNDYATHSHFLARYKHKVNIIPPPVEMPTPAAEDIVAFRQKWGVTGKAIIGMAARLASEKGVEVLLDAFERVRQTHPEAHVVYAGTYQNVLGEEKYAQRIRERVDQLNQHGTCWTFTGALSGMELAAFFGSCDVFVVPSLNSTESFGLVQVEAMLCGTPCISSDLPGVRVPVQTTGMGKVVPIGDASALANAIQIIVSNKSAYAKSRAEVETHFNTQRTLDDYENLYAELTRSATA